MSICQVNPYLNFDGTAEKAVKLYESALGAKVEAMMRFSDIPDAQPDSPHKDRVMHAHLKLDGQSLMISDTMPGHPFTHGSNVHVCLAYTDVKEMAKHFEALSQGGKVTMPLGDTFWGATFGMLVDAYGVSWMFNCEKKQA
jgi:PhnB protein